MTQPLAYSPRLPVACLAPPLSDETLATYRGMIDTLPVNSRLRQALDTLYACVAAWWELPESQRDDVTRYEVLHRGKLAYIKAQPLEAHHEKALWDLIPWSKRSTGQPDELEAIQALCDQIDPLAQAELRNAAFHLLWHVHELDLGGEPITHDKL